MAVNNYDQLRKRGLNSVLGLTEMITGRALMRTTIESFGAITLLNPHLGSSEAHLYGSTLFSKELIHG